MAEGRISNELIYELLKSIQDRLVRLDERMDRLETEMRIVRQHVGALVQSDLQHGGDIAALELSNGVEG